MSRRYELRAVFEVGDAQDLVDLEGAAREAIRQHLGALTSVSVAPVVEPRVERKTPKTADWEHCTTLDTVRGEDWLPMQPRGDKSWQLCGVLPTEYTTEYGRVKARLLWKRELP
jgi:hypothetical protein